MTVKEVKDKIVRLQESYQNLVRLQNFFLGVYDVPEETIKDLKNNIEEMAHLSIPIRDLCSTSAKFLSDEIERLNNAIDNTSVKVN